MIQGMMKELKFATASRRIVTVETPRRCGKGDVPEALPCRRRHRPARRAQELLGNGLQARPSS